MTFVQLTGDELRAWREGRGLTKEELAEILGVTPRTLLNHETSNWVPRLIALAISAAGRHLPFVGQSSRAKRGPQAQSRAPAGWITTWAAIRKDPWDFLGPFDTAAEAFRAAAAKGDGYVARWGDHEVGTDVFAWMDSTPPTKGKSAA